MITRKLKFYIYLPENFKGFFSTCSSNSVDVDYVVDGDDDVGDTDDDELAALCATKLIIIIIANLTSTIAIITNTTFF